MYNSMYRLSVPPRSVSFFASCIPPSFLRFITIILWYSFVVPRHCCCFPSKQKEEEEEEASQSFFCFSFTMKSFVFSTFFFACLSVLLLCSTSGVYGKESVAELRQRLRRQLGSYGGGGWNNTHHFGGDNGRDHPGCCGNNNSSNNGNNSNEPPLDGTPVRSNNENGNRKEFHCLPGN